MFDQEREDRDYEMMAQGSLAMCFSESQINREPDDKGKINELLDAGRFVVVREFTVYCRSTDAILGCDQCLVKDFATREEAEALCEVESVNDHDDMVTFVMPRRPPEGYYSPVSDEWKSAGGDEIPF